MTNEEMERIAYRLIRRETRRFDRETSDAELANYIKGIVDLQTEFYKAESEAIECANRE